MDDFEDEDQLIQTSTTIEKKNNSKFKTYFFRGALGFLAIAHGVVIYSVGKN